MWWRDEHIARGLRSGDMGAKRMILTLLRSHRNELDGFAARHPAFFFRTMRELVQRYEENYEVKRKTWGVLTALVNLHSKIHVHQLLFEHGLLGLALETLGGAYGQYQSCCCVNEVLEFLVALKNDNIRLFELDATVVQCLTDLPVRLGQGIDRFGYKLLIQLLRDLQVREGGACAKTVDQHTIELIERTSPTAFLILVERILEECRSYFTPHDAGPQGVAPHTHADWPSLSSWHLGALLAETAEVLRVNQGSGMISSFDRVVALKWLQANSAAITTQFRESHELIVVLSNVASDDSNTHVVQLLAVELADTLATRHTDPVALTSTAHQSTLRSPCSISTWHLSVGMQDALHKLQHGSSEHKLQAINYFTNRNAEALATTGILHVISTALRVLAVPSTPESIKEQIWKMLATIVTEAPCGTSVTCAQEYYELVSAALQVLVGDTEMSEASEGASWAETLLVGPLRGICLDEVDRNGFSWRAKSPQAEAVIATLLIHQLERTCEQKPDGIKRIWDLLSRKLETMDSEIVARVVFQNEVLAVAARSIGAADDFLQVNLPILGLVGALIRKQALPATTCRDWIKIALQFTVSTMEDPPVREFLIHFLKESVANYPECAREIEFAVPNLAQDGAEKGWMPIEFVESLIYWRDGQDSQTAPLSIPRVIHVLTSGNAFEKLVVLTHLGTFSVPEFQDFLSSFSGLAVLHHLLLHGEESQPAIVKKIVTKMAETDFYCRAHIAEFQLHNPDAAFISQDNLCRIYGRVPTELAELCRELRNAPPSTDPRDGLRRKVTNILQLARSESLTDTAFLSCMQRLFCPPVYTKLWHEQAYSLTESEGLTQMALRVLELDGTFQYREQIFYFLHEIYRQFGSTQETLVHGIPLLTQRLSEEQNANAADSLTNLLREFASSNHDMSSIIDESIQRIMDENDSNNAVVYYQNLLAVYRKHEGVTLGKPHGQHEIPNLTATVDVLSTGHSLEKLIALKLLRKYIPILPAASLPPLLLEAVSTIFGLTLAGSLQIQPVAKDVLAQLSKKDSKRAAAVSQYQDPLNLSTAPSPWVRRYHQRTTAAAAGGTSDPALGKADGRGGSVEEIQETEPEDEHIMYDSDGDLRFMYSDCDDSDGDDTIEGYGACEDREGGSALLTAREATLSRS